MDEKDPEVTFKYYFSQHRDEVWGKMDKVTPSPPNPHTSDSME